MHHRDWFVAHGLLHCAQVWALDVDSGHLSCWIDPPLGCWLGVVLAQDD